MSSNSRNKASLIWKGLLYLNAALILFFWWQGSGDLLSQGLPSILISLGRLSGLFAAAIVLLQFVFMGRNVWIEKIFGLDNLARVHRTTGQWSIFLILLHPFLLTFGYSQLADTSFLTQFFSFLSDYEDVLQAFIGLLLFCVVVVTSITVTRKRLKYEIWYFIHLIVYLAVYFSFGHQLHNGTDLLSNRIFYLYWVSLYSVVLGSYVLFRFVRPVYRFFQYQFTVSRIVRESYNVVSVYITGKNLQNLPAKPGQFIIVRFFNKKMWWQAHPFSLSMAPTGTELRITVKAVGDYTRTMDRITPGTKVFIDGPFGLFTDAVRTTNKILFIAGGIGITPIRALLEQFAPARHDSILLYANKTSQDIVLKKELESIAQNTATKIIDVLSDEKKYAGEKGFVDAERIKRLVPDVLSRDVYICGPPPMMDALIKALQSLGVPRDRIHYEKFAL